MNSYTYKTTYNQVSTNVCSEVTVNVLDQQIAVIQNHLFQNKELMLPTHMIIGETVKKATCKINILQVAFIGGDNYNEKNNCHSFCFFNTNFCFFSTKDYEGILSKFYNDHRIDANL